MDSVVSEVKATFHAFSADKVPRLASSIAYATMFALAPLLIVLVAIVGFVLGTQNGGHGHHVAEEALLLQIQTHAGPRAANAVRDMVSSQFGKPRSSIVAQVVGWILFIFTASGLFAALQDGLNTVWNIESTKGGWKQTLRDRLASFGMILVVGFLLLVSFGANAMILVASHYLRAIPVVGSPALLQVVNALLNLVVVTAIFAALFKVLPDVEIHWNDVWAGAFTTAILFIVGEALISVYISRAGIASAYGAAGSILVALLWIYYSAMILLFGAEYTKVHSKGAETKAPSVLRGTVEVPAGVDPRDQRDACMK